MNITKTPINAQVRNLNVRWSSAPAQIDSTGPSPPSHLAQDQMITTAMKSWFLQKNGHRVETMCRDADQLDDWCDANCRKMWQSSMYGELTSRTQLFNDIQYAMDGMWSENYLGYLRSRALEYANNLDDAKGLLPTYFWFEDADEALLFKLTWGGTNG